MSKFKKKSKLKKKANLKKKKKAKLKKTPKTKAVPAEVRTRVRWHWRQSPYPMSHASIASHELKFTIYKVLP